jgi:uncharacterized membrane protein
VVAPVGGGIEVVNEVVLALAAVVDKVVQGMRRQWRIDCEISSKTLMRTLVQMMTINQEAAIAIIIRNRGIILELSIKARRQGDPIPLFLEKLKTTGGIARLAIGGAALTVALVLVLKAGTAVIAAVETTKKGLHLRLLRHTHRCRRCRRKQQEGCVRCQRERPLSARASQLWDPRI